MATLYTFKKWTAFTLCSFVPGAAMYAMLMYSRNAMYGIVTLVVAMLLMILICNLLLRNPFSIMLEGTGLLTITLDSTGNLSPFITRVEKPYLVSKKMKDIYDHSAIFRMNEPYIEKRTLWQKIKSKFQKKQPNYDIEKKEAILTSGATSVIDNENEIISIKINKSEFNKSRFALYSYPCLIYNGVISTLITKDWLSDKEKESFIEHITLFLNRMIEELNGMMLNFGRYIVEQSRKQEGFFAKHKIWIWILVIGGILLLLLFARPIYDTVMGSGASIMSKGQSVIQPVAPT